MSDPMFQFTGVASQIDWGTMLDKIMANARKPEELWKSEKDTLELKKGLYEEFSGGLKQLRTTLTALKLPSTYQQKAAEFATLEPSGKDSKSIVTATVDTSAAISQWKIKVDQTALSERRFSDRTDSVSAALNLAGTFRVYVGQQWADIEVQSSDSLRDINLKLQQALDSNSKPLAVTAKIVDNRLVLESSQSGLGSTGLRTGETFTMGSSDAIYLTREASGLYPDSVTIKSGTKTYTAGTDFTYDAAQGLITWTGATKPAAGTTFEVTYTQESVTRGSGADLEDSLGTPAPHPAGITIKSGSTSYTLGKDFTYDQSAGTITWLATGSRPADGATYTVTHQHSFDNNVFTLQDITGTLVSGTLASGTGLGLGQAANHTAAQDALLEIDGLAVTRSSNEINDLIAGVKLKLVGTGTVNLDVTLDAEAAVKGIQSFVSAYNDVMDWINIRLSEESKVDKSTTSDATKDDDFYKKFGLLHGDSMLWQIKDQMRLFFATPVTGLPNAQTTKSFSSSTASLGLSGTFTVDVAGKRGKIEVTPSDSLESLRAKLTGITDITEGSAGTALGGELPLTVSIQNGRLVIQTTSSGTPGTTTRRESIMHNNGTNEDVLPFTPNANPPISGRFSISQGSTVFQEGVDYRIETRSDVEHGTVENRVVWLSGKTPSASASYTVNYTYDPNMTVVTTDGTGLDSLDFHQDNSKTSLAYAGLATEKTDFGKSGKLEFDTETFMSRMTTDNDAIANLMSTAMGKLDTYLGNLVDSSQTTVGDTTAVKGRVASQIKSLENQMKAIDKRITDFEVRMTLMQQSYYSQFVAMEQNISKLNQQLSWMTSMASQLSGTASAASS